LLDKRAGNPPMSHEYTDFDVPLLRGLGEVRLDRAKEGEPAESVLAT
jgi:hypothetical protein